jgi:ornithine cyclodeaminase/alanine dehydrogenase-like protein (mu-crystallin family)
MAGENTRAGSELLFISAPEVAKLFEPGDALTSQRLAFTALGNKTAILPDKLMVTNPVDGSVAFCYAARLSPDAAVVSKFGSVNPANAANGLPSIAALIVVLDGATGRPAAVMDGTVITTRRTAAASAVALDALAEPEISNLAVLGCGAQGLEHVRMLSRVRPIRSVRLWGPSADRRIAAARLLSVETGLPVRVADTPRDAVVGAHVVALCTLSRDPLIEASWLSPGATVISVGSIEPGRCEVGPDVVAAASLVVVDHPATAAAHAGPIVEALRTGVLSRADLVGLGDVLVGHAAGRRDPGDLIYYNSTGIGVQDAAAAATVLRRAREDQVGRYLTLGAV